MIDYAIDHALASSRVSRVVVTTDSEEIASYCKKKQLEVVMRSASLGGETPITDVYRHAVSEIDAAGKYETIVGLQVDHPDRRVSVDGALGHFFDAGADRLFSEDAGGVKNGAHYIMSRRFLETGHSERDVTITDDCTNIHTQEDLHAAENSIKRVDRRS